MFHRVMSGTKRAAQAIVRGETHSAPAHLLTATKNSLAAFRFQQSLKIRGAPTISAEACRSITSSAWRIRSTTPAADIMLDGSAIGDDDDWAPNKGAHSSQLTR